MDDTVIISANTSSSASGRKTSLEWRCEDDAPYVIYYFNEYFGGHGDSVWVKYRVDQTPPSGDDVWDLISGHRAAYLRGDYFLDRVLEFTNAAKAGTKILMEVTDLADGQKLRDTFTLGGLTAALKKLDCLPREGAPSAP